MKNIFFLFLFSFTLLSSITSAQKVYRVTEDNEKIFRKEGNKRVLRDSLPDGLYKVYCLLLPYKSMEITIKNGKKHGIEKLWFVESTKLCKETHWAKGKKHGPEYHFNGKRDTIKIYHYKNGLKHGKCVERFFSGTYIHTGFYKDGKRDSIWMFWETDVPYDKYWLAKKYRYKNGFKFLISAWDREGQLTVKNGNGYTYKHSSYTYSTYKNGMLNGPQYISYNTINKSLEKIYKNNLLIKETYFYGHDKVATVKEWYYYKEPTKLLYEGRINDYLKKAQGDYRNAYRDKDSNNYWSANYESGKLVFNGNYEDGHRACTWQWYWPNGQLRTLMDYSDSTALHYDSCGQLLSTEFKEYNTLLCKPFGWFLNTDIDSSTVHLSINNKFTENDVLWFEPHGKVRLTFYTDYDWKYHRGGRYFSWSVSGDILYLDFAKNYRTPIKSYTFKIISADKKNIVLIPISLEQ